MFMMHTTLIFKLGKYEEKNCTNYCGKILAKEEKKIQFPLPCMVLASWLKMEVKELKEKKEKKRL